jgi:predicted ArsR family transcriptional regulator
VSASAAVPLTARRSSHWLDVVADPVRLQILRVLSEVTDATISELAAHSPASYQTLRRHLEALETVGVIRARPGVSDGETSGRPAARFRLSPDVRESVRSAFGEPSAPNLA